MLIKIDHTGKRGTIYICDRCKHKIDTSEERRYKISVEIGKTQGHTYKTVLKKYDLCKHCCIVLCHAIEKGVKK